ncbi:MAG: transposase [Desulfomonile tiedjei]|nr:transposase [Desulfomonile tiedjei]
MKTPELTIYWRRLPHWRLQGSVYLITWRLAQRQPPLGPEERTCVMNTVRHFENQRYALPAYVVMDDHIHVLVIPFEEFLLQRIVHSWKSFAAKKLVKGWERTAPVWQREYRDRIVRDEAELLQKAGYILGNPFTRWPDLEEYPWVGFGSGF